MRNFVSVADGRIFLVYEEIKVIPDNRVFIDGNQVISKHIVEFNGTHYYLPDFSADEQKCIDDIKRLEKEITEKFKQTSFTALKKLKQ